MNRFLRITGAGLFIVVIIFGLFVAFNHEKASRLYGVITLFDKDKIVYNFSHMEEIFLARPVRRRSEVFIFGNAPRDLPDNFTYRGEKIVTDEFLRRRATTALLVIKDDNIAFEKYYLGTGENDRRISWSMAKSFTVTLFGIAVEKGLIDIDAPVEQYLPEMKGSGYEGVPVRDVLGMSSGVRWNEDYADFNSDINRMGRILAMGGSLDEFTTTLVNEKPSGKEFHYVSMDTHVLAMIVRRVSGKSLVDLAQQHLWSKIGLESDALWITDSTGAAFALGGLNMRTRDYARFGRLYLNGGNWNGEQIIPAEWIKAATSPSFPHNVPGEDKFGYGFQWWIGPDARPGEFFAVGIYGQYIYVNQPEHIVIAKNSADVNFMEYSPFAKFADIPFFYAKEETLTFFRAIADRLH